MTRSSIEDGGSVIKLISPISFGHVLKEFISDPVFQMFIICVLVEKRVSGLQIDNS